LAHLHIGHSVVYFRPVAVDIVTREGIPIVRVGTYELSTGTRTFAEEDLVAAANALATDPGVKAPRVRIASVEQALDLDPMAHGGEPAFGTFENLRVSADGQELLADFVGPKAVADAMHWAYPSLSIEGTPPGWTSATGRSHELVITAVALLGVHWPGVTTLEDFSEFLAEGPKIERTQDAEESILATVPQRLNVTASLDQDLVVRRFYDGLESGDVERPEGVESIWDLWVRSMRFDDTGSPYLKVTDEGSGRLFRVDFAVSGSDVTFEAFQEVVEQDVPVAAGSPRPLAPVASWASREESRALMATQHQEAHPMTDEQRQALAASFGLDPAASEDDVMAAASAAAEARAGSTPETPTTPEVPATTEPEPVAARAALPEGVVAIDAAELARLRAGTATAETLARERAESDRDTVIAAAIQQGRFAPARREHYVRAWAADPEGTRTLLTASEEDGGLAPNTIPVQARGAQPQDDLSATTEGTGWFSFEKGQVA
jgi:hypothetical protein